MQNSTLSVEFQPKNLLSKLDSVQVKVSITKLTALLTWQGKNVRLWIETKIPLLAMKFKVLNLSTSIKNERNVYIYNILFGGFFHIL